MAFGRLQHSVNAKPMADINMTPLIDVMLVLMVIFMITAPLMTSSLKLDLPKADAGTPTETPNFIAVAVDAQGRLYLDEKAIERKDLLARAREAAQRDPTTEVQLRADRAVAYGRVAELIALMQDAGLSRIGFVTETQAAGSPHRPN